MAADSASLFFDFSEMNRVQNRKLLVDSAPGGGELPSGGLTCYLFIAFGAG